MAVQADITNAEAQRVHTKDSHEVRPSKKDLRFLGKGNLAGVMAGGGILNAMQERDKRTEKK